MAVFWYLVRRLRGPCDKCFTFSFLTHFIDLNVNLLDELIVLGSWDSTSLRIFAEPLHT